MIMVSHLGIFFVKVNRADCCQTKEWYNPTMKKIYVLVILIIAILFVFLTFTSRGDDTNKKIAIESDFRNAVFEIDGIEIPLHNGIYEYDEAPGSASKTIVRYFGNEAFGDLNLDQLPDAAFLVTKESGGSGVFFYVVAAINSKDGYRMTNAYFIGDRIAPQNNRITSNELQINFATRNPGEPMSTSPSQGVTKILKITDDGRLKE